MSQHNLSQRDQKHIWHPYTQMHTAAAPIAIVKGQCAELVDDQGKVYIDAISSWWTNLHGHGHPYIANRIGQQALQLEQVIFAGFTHAPAVELAEQLLELLPDNQNRVFFSDNGSTACEVAIKMALQYWYNHGAEKQTIIAFRDSYHGDTFGAMSVSARSAFTLPFADMLFRVEFVDVPTPGNEEETFSQLETLLRSGEVAAFIAEPLLLGTAGMLMYTPDTLDSIISLCQKYDTLVILDEVLTGFGRTGKMFASDYLTAQPDIMCFSKGLTGGFLPMGLTTSTEDVYDAFLSDDKMKTFFHGHSYTANPLGCAAGLASLEVFKQEDTLTKIANIQARHEVFAKLLATNKQVTGVRVLGTVIAFEVGEGGSYFHNLRDRMYNYFIERGVLLRPLGNTLYILPPYCITNAELDTVYRAIESLLADLTSWQ
jgi:adenosylmethionine---8-amino-7-oxononanoate aminotransferase